jgi:radical SAM-linked protein
MRMFQRAVTRAELPVRYTEGFNPHIKLSFPVPRSVGMAALSDPVLLYLTNPCTPDEIRAKLSAQMPEGATIVSVENWPDNAKPHPTSANYEIDLEDKELEDLAARITRFLGAESCVVKRFDEHGEPKDAIDARAFVEELTLRNGCLRIGISFRDGQVVSPKIVVEALALQWDDLRHRLRRTSAMLREPDTTGDPRGS